MIRKKNESMKKLINSVKMLMPSQQIQRGLKNTSYLTIGYFLSMVINLFGFVYIARFLGPNIYGIYLTVGAFVGLFVILTFNGIHKVILREGAKDLNQMGDYFEKIIGIKILFTFIAINVCIILSLAMPYTLLEKFYIIVFSSTLIYRSLHDFFGTVYQAAEKMQYNAVLTVINRILFVSLAIAFLYMGFGLISLFIISIFSQFFTLLLNIRLTKRFVSFKFFNKIKWDTSILIPGLIFTILSFSVFLSSRIDLVMISLLGSTKDVGIYGAAHHIIETGFIFRNIFATAFFPIFIKSFYKKSVRWKKLFKYAIMLGLSMLLLAVIGSYFSEQVITLLFGVKYSQSGVLLSVLIFSLAIAFFTIPFTNTLQATHNEIINLKICWIAPSLNIVLNYLFFKIFGLIGIVYSTLVVGVITLPIWIFITWKVLKKQNKII